VLAHLNRRRAAAAAVAVVAGVGVAWTVTGRGDTAAPPPAQTRPVSFTFCPIPSFGALRGRLVLEDSILRNLGENVMGRELSYRYRGRPVSVYVGYEILEILEDLDFEERRATVAGRKVTVHTPKALSSRTAMRVASWEDERLEPSCSLVSVLTRRLPEAALLDVVAAVEFG
jgi:hypothetical protein